MSRRFYSFSFFIFLFFIGLPIFVSAVQVMIPGSADIQKTTVPEFIANLYNFALYFGAALAVLMIIAGAIYYTFSAVTPSQKGRGMDMIWGALWGLGLLLGSYLILKTTNIELISLRDPGGNITKNVDFKTASSTLIETTQPSKIDNTLPTVTTGQDGKLTFNFAENQTKKEDQVPFFIKNFYSFSLYFAGGAAIIMLIIGGIYYLVSATSPSGKGEGKEVVIGASLGLLLIIGSYLILKTVNPEIISLKNPGGEIAKNVDYENCRAPKKTGDGGDNQINIIPYCGLDEYPIDGDGKCKCYITDSWVSNFSETSDDDGFGGDAIDCKNPQKLTGKSAGAEVVKKAYWFYENFGEQMCYTQGSERNKCETPVAHPPANCKQGSGNYKGASDCTGFASYVYRCVMGLNPFNGEEIYGYSNKKPEQLEYYGWNKYGDPNEVKKIILEKIQPGDIISFLGNGKKHGHPEKKCRPTNSGHAMIVTKVVRRDINNPEIEIVDQTTKGILKRSQTLSAKNLQYVLSCGNLAHIKGND